MINKTEVNMTDCLCLVNSTINNNNLDSHVLGSQYGHKALCFFALCQCIVL